jgi:hypothetical protein
MGIFFSFITGEIGWSSGTASVPAVDGVYLAENGDYLLTEAGDYLAVE